jgi:hypothetical protein
MTFGQCLDGEKPIAGEQMRRPWTSMAEFVSLAVWPRITHLFDLSLVGEIRESGARLVRTQV